MKQRKNILIVLLLVCMSLLPSISCAEGLSGTVTGITANDAVMTNIQTVLSDLLAANPDLKVDFQRSTVEDLDSKINLAHASGQDYDYITVNNSSVAQLVAAGALEPLDPYLEAAGIDLSENYSESLLEVGMVDGKLYAIPQDPDCRVLIYNKKLLDEAGFDPPKTQEDILTISKALCGDGVYAFARQYALCVIVIGGVPTVLSNVLANLIRSIGRSKEASAGIILGGLLNIALDPLFMFVLMPDGFEVLGAGVATCISNCTALLFFISVLLRMGRGRVITFSPKLGLPSRGNVMAVFGVGLPSAITTFLFDLDYVIIDKLMVSYHDLALAAVGIVLKVERFPLNVGIGICQGMVPLVAYNYSAGNQRRMDEVIHLSFRLGLIIAAISIVLYELFAVQFSHLFISDPQTVELASQFLRIRVLATPLMFMSFFTVHLFQAFGKGRISLFLGVSRWLVLNIPMMFILNALFGMFGVVWSQVAADSLTVLLSLYIYRRHRPRPSPLA